MLRIALLVLLTLPGCSFKSNKSYLNDYLRGQRKSYQDYRKYSQGKATAWRSGYIGGIIRQWENSK